ncbi:hypothetical protein V2S66_26705 [Streptomyces sp. V4-01]|uniref:Uncharacterized protein n=1 Tax=Actinacidiphila polyblastidii TaxID=3110430 RepID=A0ABU7PIE1_9ACTN|nr:hypothetical protein [Streptomyces sp. V4-01]
MSAPLSPERLAEIAARAEAATEGPWEPCPGISRTFYGYLQGEYLRGVGDINFGVGEQANADLAFVLAAREDVPALVAELDEMRAVLAQSEQELTGARLALWEEEQDTRRLRVALRSARRGRAAARTRLAELEAERHSTNEALDDAVTALRDAAAERQFAVEAGHAVASGGPVLPWLTALDPGDIQDLASDLDEATIGWRREPEQVLARVEQVLVQFRARAAGAGEPA